MATTGIIQDISIHLRDLLVNGPGSPFAPQNISLESPAEFADSAPGNVSLSLYLFHIQRNEHLNNQANLYISNQKIARPFYVDLHYLITPVETSEPDNLPLMAYCIQILSAHGILRDPAWRLNHEPSQGEIRLRMLPYDLEAMSTLWGAFTKPYRLSVAYEVAAVPIESVIPPESGPPVEEAIIDVQIARGNR